MKAIRKGNLKRGDAEFMTNRQLIELTLEGEPVAFDVLAQRNRHQVEAVARQFLRIADREDCIQETFLRALVNLPKLKDPEKFGSWVCVIARNNCFDILKKSAAVSSIDDDTCGTPSALRLPSPRPAPLMEFISKEDNSRLIAGMQLLNENYRKILDLRYFEDCDYATIAKKMHKPLGTVKSLIHRAHERLYQLMADGAIQEGRAVVN